ncbi:hypothetical protein GNP84_19975 [Aliivibrio fischeri]|uniref:hypothetical protein n=1 Tax=Aliivibrio fischeri TaxID=668 RepID=UPI0012D99743|nr:hypothetical protein [Aliivibrio fischeri]MUK79154.1 hypothetical protein [Aliivibrio fischeri]
MITFIFGAGASYGSGMTVPYNPPLGNYLFNNLVSLNGEFSRLSKKSRDVFEQYGFEDGMATISNDSQIINPLQKEIACYLSKFQVTNENAYTRLFNKIRNLMPKVNVVTLNYDTLIEQALALNHYHTDYNGSGYGVTVLKPHGSSNFLPKIPTGSSFENITAVGCRTFFEGLQTDAVSTCDEVKQWCNNPQNGSLSPVLSMYEKGKRVVINTELINNIQNKYKSVISESNLVVLIGIKYIPDDTHILQPLENNNSFLLVVDPYPEEINEWIKKTGKKNTKVIQSGFSDSVWEITKSIRKYCE